MLGKFVCILVSLNFPYFGNSRPNEGHQGTPSPVQSFKYKLLMNVFLTEPSKTIGGLGKTLMRGPVQQIRLFAFLFPWELNDFMTGKTVMILFFIFRL